MGKQVTLCDQISSFYSDPARLDMEQVTLCDQISSIYSDPARLDRVLVNIKIHMIGFGYQFFGPAFIGYNMSTDFYILYLNPVF